MFRALAATTRILWSRAESARTFAIVAAVVVAVGASSGRTIAAQGVAFTPRTQWELRTDVIVGRTTTLALAAGANMPTGTFVRTGVLVALGAAPRGGRNAVVWRADAVARYLLDPFREIRWGAYGGAGITASWNARDRGRADLLLVAGLEGPAARGWRASAEVGIGGGSRIGLALRRVRANGR